MISGTVVASTFLAFDAINDSRAMPANVPMGSNIAAIPAS